MTKLTIVIPALTIGIGFACSHDDKDLPAPTVGSEVRVSAAIQADIDGLEGVSVELTPAEYCDGPAGRLDDDETPYAFDLDITQMAYPDGSPWGAATDYIYLLAEAEFSGLVPGCYDVVATPLGENGKALESCFAQDVTFTAEENGALVVDLSIQCSEVPREELEVLDGNFEPHIDEIVAEQTVSPCEVTRICATARDADYDALAFEWDLPAGILDAATTSPPIVMHTVNPDRSVTQCIAVQARDSGTYDIGLSVYDVYRSPTTGFGALKIEDVLGTDSHASDSITLDATLGCEATGRSAVFLLTFDNDPGLAPADARTLIGNTMEWIKPLEVTGNPAVLVVLDDNHHGEDWQDGEYIYDHITTMGYSVDYMVEPTDGLDFGDLEAYDIVWFVNPGHEMDDALTHTALLRWRNLGGGLILSGDDMARFRGAPEYMAPLTYLGWTSNGTNACGVRTDNNLGENYEVGFETDSAAPHPIAAGLESLRFEYGNDIDMTRALNMGEEVLAWARFTTKSCEVRTPVVVALDPDKLLPW